MAFVHDAAVALDAIHEDVVSVLRLAGFHRVWPRRCFIQRSGRLKPERLVRALLVVLLAKSIEDTLLLPEVALGPNQRPKLRRGAFDPHKCRSCGPLIDGAYERQLEKSTKPILFGLNLRVTQTNGDPMLELFRSPHFRQSIGSASSLSSKKWFLVTRE